MWLHQIRQILDSKLDFVIITIIGIKGSTPCSLGDKMLHTLKSSYGSIGGGNLEYKILTLAEQLLNAKTNKQHTKIYPLGATIGQCCGGIVTVLFECFVDLKSKQQKWLKILTNLYDKQIDLVMISYIKNSTHHKIIHAYQDDTLGKCLTMDTLGQDFKMQTHKITSNKHSIYSIKATNTESIAYFEPFLFSKMQVVAVFGAGHIGRALMPMLSVLPIKLYWIDDRKPQFSLYQYDKNNINIICDEALSVIASFPKNTYYLVITYSHQLDFAICEAILKAGNFSYLGLIGSTIKGRRFRQKLLVKGYDNNLVTQLICPIGIKQKHTKSPMAIAVSIVMTLINYLEQK